MSLPMRSVPSRCWPLGRLQALGRVDLEHVVRDASRAPARGAPRARAAQDQHQADERRPVPREAREDERARAAHDARSRGSMKVWAMSTSRLTTRKIAPAHTVKPITAL